VICNGIAVPGVELDRTITDKKKFCKVFYLILFGEDAYHIKLPKICLGIFSRLMVSLITF